MYKILLELNYSINIIKKGRRNVEEKLLLIYGKIDKKINQKNVSINEYEIIVNSWLEILENIDNNTLSFLKVSKPANAIEFYQPVFEFLDNFEKEKLKTKVVQELIIDFKFDYFNTATAKIIYELLAKFKRIKQQGIDIIIKWFYYEDDEDLLEEGKMMAEAVGLDFKFITLPENN